jgi:hypothetical protein
MNQLALTLEPGLAVRYRDLRECFAACVYKEGLGRVAAMVDEKPSNLSAMLSGERNLDGGIIERYMREFGDTTPARYWAAKWLGDPELLKAFAQSLLPNAIADLRTLLDAAGVDVGSQKKGRR